MLRSSVIFALCVALSGCRHAPAAHTSVPAPEPAMAPEPAKAPAVDTAAGSLAGEFRGAYSRGFEASWFVPCDAAPDDALWWVTLTEEARLQRDSLLKTLTGPGTRALAVRWRGTAGPRMQAGHMGQGSRYLLVTQVLEVRPLLTKSGCPFHLTSLPSSSIWTVRAGGWPVP